MGLASALEWYVRGFSRRSGIRVELEVLPDTGRLSNETETTLFRIVQEGLSNIHRHSGSSSAAIRLSREENQVVLQIKDHGRGMALRSESETPETIQSLGVGILGMRQRLRQLGGRLKIDSGTGGTTIWAMVPLARKEENASNTSSGRSQLDAAGNEEFARSP
jgi:signal transduction histidine kinase